MIPPRRLHRWLAFWMAVSLIAAAGLHAEEAGGSANFDRLLENPQHQAMVRDAVRNLLTLLIGSCELVENTPSPVMTIYRPLQFDAQGAAVAGAWAETSEASGCGASRTVHVLTVVQPSGALSSFALLPGTTHADPLLQKDAMTYAIMGTQPPPGCEKIYVSDTKFVESEGPPDPRLPGRRPPPWPEEWSMVACDKLAIVTMHFIPDATGTTIHVSLNETQPQ